jgi:hypothetical protein
MECLYLPSDHDEQDVEAEDGLMDKILQQKSF